MLEDNQLKTWTDEFGDEYTERNEFADWKVPYGVKAFRQMLDGLKIKSVLEVGSNIGLNLHFIQEVFKGNIENYAMEPNKKAYDRLVCDSDNLKLKKAWNCDAFNMPLNDSSIDLVFTAGVLIHIAPERLGLATDEIVRVAKRYILCIEYFSHKPAELKYRGRDGLLYKQDFGGYYLDRFAYIKCIKYGFLWQREFKIFDDLTWWLFDKKGAKNCNG